MNRIWKNLQVSAMYWRFRHITRNRLRFQSWYRRKRLGSMRFHQSSPGGYRPRGSALPIYRTSSKRTWLILVAMVAALTALRVATSQGSLGGTLSYALGVFVVIGAFYWALHQA